MHTLRIALLLAAGQIPGLLAATPPLMPMTHFSVGDRMAEAHAMVMLVEQGWAPEALVSRVWEIAQRSFLVEAAGSAGI